ncbi:MAG: hypothetical protein LUM44_04010 [Pyrinomonadaceae bacterium]|nr:hypothetical protein [Pyrinomonadaceae bacterium]
MEAVQAKKDSRESAFWDAVIFPLIFIIAFKFLELFFAVPFALFLASGIAAFFAYFDAPKKNIGFFKFLFSILSVSLSFIAVWYWLAPFLADFIPPFLAYFLPFSVLANLLYLMPPLKERKPIPFWKWTLGSLIFSALAAYFIGNAK